MKKRPSLILREPVKLYETKRTEEVKPQLVEKKVVAEKKATKIELVKSHENKKEEPKNSEGIEKAKLLKSDSLREKMSPRVQQIWDYFCKKAKEGGEIKTSFNLTRSEVMKEANIGSTNTYRDALKKFQDLNLLEIELRPGVNSGSIFTLTKKGLEELD